ncbi:hypothetical protein ONZ45_g18994 [Pleurotus djamor]|nr:hypothetical protein ONZ45_g18994 [Pleurotus djamor]
MSTNGLLYANFNQDYTCVSVGTRKGYSITNCDPFGRVYTMNDGARGIVEMLFCTSLLAIVGVADHPKSSPRKLQIVNTKRQSMICELLFPSSILAVKLNRKTLVIVLEMEIYIYDISNMRLLHVLETAANPDAICALSPNAEASYLAYPSRIPSPNSPLSSTSSSPPPPTTTTHPGDVTLLSTTSLSTTNIIPGAHKSPLSILQLSQNGSMLATASVKGTVVRVWSVPGAEMLYQFRRGTREMRIWSVAFNPVGSLMAVGSASGTVHLFKLGRASTSTSSSSASAASAGGKKDALPSPTGSMDSRDGGGVEGGYEAYLETKKTKSMSSSLRHKSLQFSKHLSHSVGGYLPSAVTEMWEPTRDFAWLKLPSPMAGGSADGPKSSKCIVGLSGSMPQIMVVSSDGYFYTYSVDLEKGGECLLMKQYSLLDSGDDSSSVTRVE